MPTLSEWNFKSWSIRCEALVTADRFEALVQIVVSSSCAASSQSTVYRITPSARAGQYVSGDRQDPACQQPRNEDARRLVSLLETYVPGICGARAQKDRCW